MKTAEQFLQQMHYPANTQVCVEMNWLEKISHVGAHGIATKLIQAFVLKWCIGVKSFVTWVWAMACHMSPEICLYGVAIFNRCATDF